jgi:hypothetical protein
MAKATIDVTYFLEHAQDVVDQHLNWWAVELLAESFAHERDRFGGGGVCILAFGKDDKPLYITINVEPPKNEEPPEGKGGTSA